MSTQNQPSSAHPVNLSFPTKLSDSNRLKVTLGLLSFLISPVFSSATLAQPATALPPSPTQQWVSVPTGIIPDNAVKASFNSSPQAYVCRGWINQAWVLGTTVVGLGGCRWQNQGTWRVAERYELLITERNLTGRQGIGYGRRSLRRPLLETERDLISATQALRTAINPDPRLGSFLSDSERQTLHQQAIALETLAFAADCPSVEAKARQLSRNLGDWTLTSRTWIQDDLRNLDQSARSCIRR